MATNPGTLVSKLWNYCSILRDDGLSYGDYVKQLMALVDALETQLAVSRATAANILSALVAELTATS